MSSSKSLHPAFGRALESASLPREEHGKQKKTVIAEPGRGWHLGEPLKLSTDDLLRVAIAAGRSEIVRLFGGEPPADDPSEERFRQLERWLSSADRPSVMDVIAFETSSSGNFTTRRCLSAAKEMWGNGKPARAEALLRDAIGQATPSAYDEGGRDGARAWLDGLDRAMMRIEMQSLVRPLDAAAAERIEQVLFRATKPIDARVAQLAGGRYGAWTKPGRKPPQWTEGSRDDIIAVVPATASRL